MLLVTSPGLPFRGYKVIHGWELHLQGLGVCGSDQTVNQGQLPPILDLDMVIKCLKALPDLVMPTGCLLCSATERALGSM